jgi:hypothetical protein
MVTIRYANDARGITAATALMRSHPKLTAQRGSMASMFFHKMIFHQIHKDRARGPNR